MNRKVKKTLIFVFLITSIIVTVFSVNLLILFKEFYVDRIYIDDNSDNNWNWAASQPWCSGAGTKNDPYIIENLVIGDNQRTRDYGYGDYGCIRIRNSKLFFIIRNCILFNREWGIFLFNVQNGVIANNTIIYQRYGIRIANSTYNNIRGNIFNNNWVYCIDIICSNHTHISRNTMYRDDSNFYPDYGVIMSNCHDNILNGNQMKNCGVKIEGNIEELLSHDITDTNTVNGKPVYYYTNEVALNSNNFTNPGQIILVNCSYSILSNLNLLHGSDGISLFYCENNLLTDNNITHNLKWGIYLFRSNMNNISGNNIIDNLGGIGLGNSNNSIISENNLNNNKNALIISKRSSNNKVQTNTVKNNERGISGYDCNYNEIFDNDICNNRFSIELTLCNRNNLSRNIVKGNFVGINLYLSDENIIYGNIANNNGRRGGGNGIELYWCDDNVICDNNASENEEAGILIYGDRNTVFNNNLFSNIKYGLLIAVSDWNTLFKNQFIGNGFSNALDDSGRNKWDNGTIGNYWSDYSGVDADDDGIGDTPYLISGNSGSIDNYPIWDDGPN